MLSPGSPSPLLRRVGNLGSSFTENSLLSPGRPEKVLGLVRIGHGVQISVESSELSPAVWTDGLPKSNMNSRLVLYFYSEVLLHEKCTIYIRIHTICRDSHKILGNWSNLSFWEHIEDRLGVAVDLGPSLDVAAEQG